MSSDIAVRVQRVSKCYNVYENPTDRLLQALYPRAARVVKMAGARDTAQRLLERRAFREFWALRDVDLEVRRGETVGIVGRNGSGKSTLLQMIAGTLSPTTGQIDVTGRVAALLELGSGFNPEFTGLENIRLNATVLGLTPSEIDARMDSILAFADIGEFVNRPIKTYSSGMIMRLAFAVQAQVEPDILIVDEALAVGDAKFQSKCFARLDVLKESGTSILFVSHSTEQVVSHCDRAVLLHEGRVHETGRPKDVVHTYLDLLFGGSRGTQAAASTSSQEAAPSSPPDVPETAGNRFSTRPGYNPYEYRWGDGAACIADYCVSGLQGSNTTVIRSGAKIALSFGISFLRDVQRPILGLTIKTKDGITVYGVNTEIATAPKLALSGLAGTHARVTFDFDCRLGPGDYFVSVGIASRDGEDVVPHDRRYDSIHLNVVGTGFFGLTQLDMGIDALEVSP